MPGTLKVTYCGVLIMFCRYETPIGRQAILSLITALYATQEYTVAIIPDECTTSEVLAQLSNCREAEAYCRGFGIRRAGDHTAGTVDVA